MADDFISKTTDVIFAAGESGPKQVVVEIIDDPLVETVESFKLSMTSSNPIVKIGDPSEVKIIDNDGKCSLNLYK